jgi:hypothetical protein
MLADAATPTSSEGVADVVIPDLASTDMSVTGMDAAIANLFIADMVVTVRARTAGGACSDLQ